jgi:hypothetical protein
MRNISWAQITFPNRECRLRVEEAAEAELQRQREAAAVRWNAMKKIDIGKAAREMAAREAAEAAAALAMDGRAIQTSLIIFQS